MNFLSIAANKLGDHTSSRVNSPDTVFGRMVGAFQGEEASATPEQERVARQNGFRNYDEMFQWSRQRAQNSGNTVQGTSGVEAGLDQIRNGGGAAMMHPKNMFNWLRDRISEATGNR